MDNTFLTGSPISLELRNPQQPLSQMNLQTVTKTLTIDTRFREQYYKRNVEDIIIDLPEPLENVINLNISSVSIPGTIYNINSSVGNNYFHIYDPSGLSIFGHNVAGPALRKFVVTNGNYLYPDSSAPTVGNGRYVRVYGEASGGQIVGAINNAIEYDLITNEPIKKTTNGDYVKYYEIFTRNDMTIPFELEIFTYRSRFRFTGGGIRNWPDSEFRLFFNLKPYATTTPDIDPNVVDPNPLQLKLGWLLGYRFGEYKVSNTDQKSLFESEGVYDPQSPRYFYILVNDYNKNFNSNVVSYFNRSSLNNDVMARVAIDVSFKQSNGPSFLTYAMSTPRNYHGPVKISKLQLKFIDPYGRKMNIHNMDYSVSFQVTSLLSN